MVELHEKQREVVRSRARFKVVRAGRRSGKTVYKQETMLWNAVSRTIELARRVPDRAVIFIAPTQKQARTIVWEAFKSRLGKLGEYNESRLEIRLPTEEGGTATIFIGGWENRENYRGMPNVVHVEFDELDTMKDFFVGWQEIFRPMLIDTGGSAGFGGTPKKENPNLRRLEKEYAHDSEWAFFHFTTFDNPHVPPEEIVKARESMDADTYRQEILAEYVENQGALFHYNALLDMFTNEPVKGENFLTVDIADDGSDNTIFTPWNGLTAHSIERHQNMRTDQVIQHIRELQALHKIPMSHTAVDAVGVGAGVASSPILNGVVGFKSSYQAIKTDPDIVRLPNVHYLGDAPLVTEYRNLRSQCVFALSYLVNNHDVAIKTDDTRIRSQIIEELSNYQNASRGDGKTMATEKEDIKGIIGRSPDISDTLIMRMYFVVRGKMLPTTEAQQQLRSKLQAQFQRNQNNQSLNSTR